MPILPALATQFASQFPATDGGRERWRWFVLTLQAILVPITASRTSNLLRAIATLFGVEIAEARYYTFMASVKLRWDALWDILWRAIPQPLTDGRLVVALDDSINAKTGRKVFACQTTVDHAAKTNQTQYPWAQTIVTVGLLKAIHSRWCCLPLAFAYYLRRQTLALRCVRVRGEAVVFQTKFTQSVRLIVRLAGAFPKVPVLVVADIWFGNRGLLQPLAAELGARAHLLSRLRVKAVLYDLPTPRPGRAGRPRNYGVRLGNATDLASPLRAAARTYTLDPMVGCARCSPLIVWSCSSLCVARSAWFGSSTASTGWPWRLRN